MAKLEIEELVEVYNDLLTFDKQLDDVRIYIFKDKNDFVEKYVKKNLLKMKVSEPISGESFDKKFKKYLEEINTLIKPFKDDEVIIIGVFGNYVDSIELGKNKIYIYRIEELDLLREDIESYYNN